MARTRSVTIKEESGELEQLRQYYAGKPESRRILFLLFLKENSQRTVAEAARKVRISERRGRYWWDAYRKGGLQQLLDRRVWRKSEKEESPESLAHFGESTSSVSSVSDGRSWVSFLNAVAANSSEIEDVRRWMAGFREALSLLLGDVDFIAINVRTGINVLEIGKGKIFSYLQYSDKTGLKGHRVDKTGEHKHHYESLVESGRKAGFPFDDYQSPPVGFDFFLEPGRREYQPGDDDSLVASLLLLRRKHNPPISQESIDLVERLRPFIVYAVTDFVVRSSLASSKGQEIEPMVRKVAGNANLTQQESKVLLLAFMGHSYHEIGESLHVSINTVQTHIRAIYRKTGVSKLSEVYAKFLTPRAFPDETQP